MLYLATSYDSFKLNTKEDSLKNIDIQTVLVPIEFSSIFLSPFVRNNLVNQVKHVKHHCYYKLENYNVFCGT